MASRGARLIAVAVLAAAFASIAMACNPTSTGPTASLPAGPSASTATSPRPSPKPTVAPSADPGQAAVRGFIALASDRNLSYQATFTGHQRASVTIVKITKGVTQAGNGDVLVRATFTFPSGGTYTVEHRLVEGKAWLRTAPAAWARLTDFKPADTMAAFAAVHGNADVTYLGPRKVAGKTLYQVRIASAIVNPIMVPAINLSERSVTSSRFDVLIDGAGRPVSGEAEITGRGRVSGQLQEIAIDLAVTFSKVGGPVSIAAP
jgi:hypothetical protein